MGADVGLLQVTGCDYAMKDFVKVSGRRTEEGPAPAAPQPSDKSS